MMYLIFTFLLTLAISAGAVEPEASPTNQSIADALDSPTVGDGFKSPKLTWRSTSRVLEAPVTNETLKIEFPFRNANKEEVRLEVVRTSSEHLLKPTEPIKVGAGKSGVLALTYTVGDLRGVQRASAWVRVSHASDPVREPVEIPQPDKILQALSEEDRKAWLAKSRDAMLKSRQQEKSLTKLDLIVKIAHDLEISPATLYWARDHDAQLEAEPDKTAALANPPQNEAAKSAEGEKPLASKPVYPGVLSPTQRAIIVSLPIVQKESHAEPQSTSPPITLAAVEATFPHADKSIIAPPIKLLKSERQPDGTWQLIFERTIDPAELAQRSSRGELTIAATTSDGKQLARKLSWIIEKPNQDATTPPLLSGQAR